MSQTILIPSFKSRINRLNGLKTGVSSGDRRTPACTRVVWDYLGADINRVNAYRQVMLYSPDDPRIDALMAIVSEDVARDLAAVPENVRAAVRAFAGDDPIAQRNAVQRGHARHARAAQHARSGERALCAERRQR